MRAWVPSATALASRDPQALAPGNLSAQARAEFGAQVLRLLSGHQVHWLGSTGCGHVHARSVALATSAPRGVVAPDPRLALSTTPTPMPLPHWSGFESDAGNFTGASMTWTVPAPLASTAPAALSIWPGIGTGTDATSDLLIQAGTAQDQSGTTFAWTEVVPGEFEVPVMGMTVTARDNMAVGVSWDKATHTAAFLVSDVTSHNTKMITQAVSGSPGGSAEWIVERTVSCGNNACNIGLFPHLLNFGSVQIVNGFADQTNGGITTGNYIKAWPHLVVHDMQACASKSNLAIPTQLDSQGDFLDTFDHAGPVDPLFCDWTISPPNAPFRATLPNATGAAQLIDRAAGLAITCHQATLSGTTNVNPSQQGSLATFVMINTSTFGACADSSSGVWSVAQVAGSVWKLDGGTPSLDGVMTGEIDFVAADVSGNISGQTCGFRLTGRDTAGDAIFTNPDQLKITGAGLTVSGVSGAGCSTAGVHDGDTFTWSALYNTTNTTIQPGPG